MCLKYFSKTFKLLLLQGSYIVKNIFLNIYVTEILLCLEYVQKSTQVHKSNHQKGCSIKIDCHWRSVNASDLEPYLEKSSYANIFQSTANVEQSITKR